MAVVICPPSGVLPLVILQRGSSVYNIVRRIRGLVVYNASSRDEQGGGADEVYSVTVLSVSRGERPQLKSHFCFQAGSRLVDIHGVCHSRSPSPRTRFPFPSRRGPHINWRGGPVSPQSRKPSSARLGIFPVAKLHFAK
jgi:hypothetical protein